ncbi:SDR family oxidoreductase [Streptomyces sp. NPDC094437]|uniref:SDR family oxidoreductase n=1 Tax=Streptomyces sp. NPDC094437 TaxID=3366060 RepID=UPI00380D9E70
MSDSPVALVTGGGSGIGAAVARQLLGAGYRVAVTGRSEERLRGFAAELGEPEGLLAIAGDTAEYAQVCGAVEATVAAFGRLDTVVANAGFASPGARSLVDGDTDGWAEMVLTNVLGPALLIRASVDALKATRGRIVLVGSVAGFVHSPGNLYGATKWAVTGLAESTRLAVAEFGIGVTLIAPGRVETPFWDGLGGVPEGRLLTADQIADSVVWAVRQPDGVDVNTVIVRPLGQLI